MSDHDGFTYLGVHYPDAQVFAELPADVRATHKMHQPVVRDIRTNMHDDYPSRPDWRIVCGTCGLLLDGRRLFEDLGFNTTDWESEPLEPGS